MEDIHDRVKMLIDNSPPGFSLIMGSPRAYNSAIEYLERHGPVRIREIEPGVYKVKSAKGDIVLRKEYLSDIPEETI